MNDSFDTLKNWHLCKKNLNQRGDIKREKIGGRMNLMFILKKKEKTKGRNEK